MKSLVIHFSFLGLLRVILASTTILFSITNSYGQFDLKNECKSEDCHNTYGKLSTNKIVDSEILNSTFDFIETIYNSVDSYINTPSISNKFNNSYAIVIGVGKYNDSTNFDNIDFANDDAVMMTNFLVNVAKFDYVVTLTNEKASKENIEEYMGSIFPKNLKSNDRFLFYFSGHGTQETFQGITEEGYLVLQKSKKDELHTMINMSSLAAWNKKISYTKHALFLLDCCFSGLAGLIDCGKSKSYRDKTVNRLSQYGHHLLTAGTKGERSWGGCTKNNDLVECGSYFTKFFIDAASGEGDKSSGRFEKDGLVSLTEIIHEIGLRIDISRDIRIFSGKMSPQVRVFCPPEFTIDNAGEFFFESLNPQVYQKKHSHKAQYTSPELLKDKDGSGKNIELLNLAGGGFDINLIETELNFLEELRPLEIVFDFPEFSSVLSKSNYERIYESMPRELSNNVTKSVGIDISFSPKEWAELSERSYKYLWDDRAGRIEDAFIEFYDPEGLTGMVDSLEFILEPATEDWIQFLDTLKNSRRIEPSVKKKIRDIINSPGSLEEKANRLHTIGKANYSLLESEVFSKLSSARIGILAVVEKLSPQQINDKVSRILNDEIASTELTPDQLLYGANSLDDLVEQIKIYSIGVDVYGRWDFHQNLGASFLKRAKIARDEDKKSEFISKALNHLKISSLERLSFQALTNIGEAFIMLGEFDEARKVFDKLSSSKFRSKLLEQFEYNLPNTDLQDLIRSQSVYNLGLLDLLDRNNSEALYHFNRMTNAITTDTIYNLGVVYFSSAIANLRMGNTQEAISNLINAFGYDPLLKQKAINSREFLEIKYEIDEL